MLTEGEQAELHLHFRHTRRTADIAERFGVSERSVSLWRKHWRIFGRIYPPKATVQGRPRLLTKEQMEVCIVAPTYRLVLTLRQ
jgi:transposase